LFNLTYTERTALNWTSIPHHHIII